jgi:monovalent cation:H+ antiporter-2, CPA2 family
MPECARCFLSDDGILEVGSVLLQSTASGAAPPLVSQLALVLVGAAVVGYLCQRIGLIPIVGYLATGVVLGPYALGVVSSTELVDQLAEVGVILLLFSIGLELSGDQLKRMGPLMFGGGALQVVLTVVAVAGGAALLAGVDIRSGIYTGCLIALSSTAVVLKMLSTKGTTGSPTGQVSVAFLIFQDIAVVLMVLVVPLLGQGGGSLWDVAVVLVKSLVIIVVVIVGTRRVVPRVLGAVSARTNEEEFLLAILAIAVGIAFLVTLFGLSASLGAFIAGLVVSSGPHRSRATRYVEPFQVVFATVFFASIGMLLDPRFLLDNLGSVAALVVTVLVLKIVTSGLAARAFGQPWPVVGASALLLAQLGEFAFVLERSGREVGLSPFALGETGSQTLIAASVALFALTPALYALGERILRRGPASAPAPTADRVVVIGSAEHLPALERIVTETLPGVVVVASDVTGVSGPRGRRDPSVRLIVVDSSAGAAVADIVRAAVRAEPPVPTIVRTSRRLDVDHVGTVDDALTLVVDEEAGDAALAREIARFQ